MQARACLRPKTSNSWNHAGMENLYNKEKTRELALGMRVLLDELAHFAERLFDAAHERKRVVVRNDVIDADGDGCALGVAVRTSTVALRDRLVGGDETDVHRLVDAHVLERE